VNLKIMFNFEDISLAFPAPHFMEENDTLPCVMHILPQHVQ